MAHERWMRTALVTIALALPSASTSSAQNCLITAPATVAANAAFTLCGPSASGYTYEWYGPGLSANSTTRCINASGLDHRWHDRHAVRARRPHPFL